MDPDTMKAGLLMEAAQAHQQLAQAALQRLDAATSRLEPAMRDAVTKAALQEFEALFKLMYGQMHQEANHTAQTLKKLRSGFTWRLGTLASLISAGSTAVVLLGLLIGAYFGGAFERPAATSAALAATTSPTRLRADAATLAELERRGLLIDVALCGDPNSNPRRVCVRVEPKTGAFGPRKDLMVVGGS